MGRRSASPVVALAAAITMIGCAGTGAVTPTSPNASEAHPSAPDITPAPMAKVNVTLSASGCRADAEDAIPAGPGFTVTAANATADDAGFDLYRLRANATYDDWVEYHEAAAAAIAVGEEGPGDPTSIAEGVDLMNAVAAGRTGELVAAGAEAGIYVLQCWGFPTTGTGSLDWTEPITVGTGS